jgi:hypothetical protein
MASIHPRVQFSSLPFELRQKIWVTTFFPRTIELRIHQTFKLTQGPITKADSIVSPQSPNLHRPLEMVSIYSTATILPEDSTSDQRSYRTDPDLRSCPELGTPPAPIAMSVFCGSRDLLWNAISYHSAEQSTGRALALAIETLTMRNGSAASTGEKRV